MVRIEYIRNNISHSSVLRNTAYLRHIFHVNGQYTAVNTLSTSTVLFTLHINYVFIYTYLSMHLFACMKIMYYINGCFSNSALRTYIAISNVS